MKKWSWIAWGAGSRDHWGLIHSYDPKLCNSPPLDKRLQTILKRRLKTCQFTSALNQLSDAGLSPAHLLIQLWKFLPSSCFITSVRWPRKQDDSLMRLPHDQLNVTFHSPLECGQSYLISPAIYPEGAMCWAGGSCNSWQQMASCTDERRE